MNYIVNNLLLLSVNVETQLAVLFSAIVIILLTVICLTIIKKNKDKD